MPKRLSSSILSAIPIATAAFGLTILLTNLSFFAFLDLKGLDLLFTLRGALPSPEKIIIVAIDEPSMAEIEQQWPWPRSLHAQLIQQLNHAGAKVIGFDILFAEPSEPAEDRALAHALQEAGNVVLTNTVSVINDPLFRHSVRVDPIPTFRNAAAVGSPLIDIDADGVVRRVRLQALDQPPFALQIIRHFLEKPISKALLPRLKRDWLAGTEWLIDFLGPARTFKTVSYYQALDYERLLPAGTFAGKIVLVGRSLEASPEPSTPSGDMFFTPFSWISGESTAGVEIQANLICNFLEGQFIIEPDQIKQWILLFTLILATSLLIAGRPPIAALAIVGILASLLIGIAYLVFMKMDLWFPFLSATFGLILVYGGHLLAQAFMAERERRRLLETINQNLEAKIAERTQELSSAHHELHQRHQQLEATYRELAHTQAQLIQSEKMASLGLLVAGVAHELNNPISYVNSNLDFIKDYTERLVKICKTHLKTNPSITDSISSPNEENKAIDHFDSTLKTLFELIASCKDGTDRVKKIVLDLRSFSRIENTGFMATDLQQGIEFSLSFFANQHKERIVIHRHYNDLPKIECHPSKINQVFMNMIQNAIQSIPDKGDIWIKTELQENWVKIIVRDNGIGIVKENLHRIFDPFFTTKPIGTGTGLGLSITYNIIKEHHGNIEVHSEINKGTEFTIELPIQQPRITE
ncbi:MAG: CHASE2 domain-containing protein [Gammaproteobacteria bacterium]|nr:CHASE2 domain-containing protein [Gammaproteobacteria bacterium]